ncbi:Lipopolysaccharide export system ATP-binding protein LptB [Candidatus Entotheonellaceae bacterium PAL068K]
MPRRGGLTTHAISKMYRGYFIVRDVSLHVAAGEIVSLLGPNGAGKTTTFYILVGLIRPHGGSVCLDDIVLTHLPMHRRARLGIGYLPQEPSIFRKMTVEENLRAILDLQPGTRIAKQEKTEELLEIFALTELRQIKGYILSGGERRRVELARLLAISPRFILLDEPFTGIDPIMVGELQSFIFVLKQQGIGILITDHRVRETLEITDRVYIMHAGRILHSGNPQELVENPEVKQIYLGERFSFSAKAKEVG